MALPCKLYYIPLNIISVVVLFIMNNLFYLLNFNLFMVHILVVLPKPLSSCQVVP